MASPRVFQRALISGIAGSGGSFLADHIAEHHPDVEVFGLARWRTSSTWAGAHPAGGATILECDLLDLSSILRAMDVARPDVIFHLASHANVRASFDVPVAVLHNNIIGTANLFEAIRLTRFDPLVQLCSTSEVYGQVPPEFVPITEECPIRPVSPYAVSKASQDLLGYSYFRSFGTRIIRTRMFAYLNPRRSDLFATAFAVQIARIEAGLQDELRHGNLESVRTIVDVRDAMAAYWAAAERCEPGEVYNIGGETVTSVGDLLSELQALALKPIPTRQDPTLLRPADVTLQIPSVAKFKAATGWAARYSFRESVSHLLGHCRDEVARQNARSGTQTGGQ